ncbi:hypothetical protein [uncultured Ferrimonas sp.]|uniref:hypothetical protein n=1 Tax=uncultured Ferrimonas sp. TaxID=432640 RepID=UPI00261DFC82|nr:hypothetical protein [uncultured Ferrimonas sp.]
MFNKIRTLVTVVLLLITPFCWAEADRSKPLQLAEPLQQFAPYVGKTWRGEFSDSTAAKPMIDVSHWSVALQGQAVRITHSLNQGEYEGETMIVFNGQTQQLEFFYFTTAGFYTIGRAEFDGSAFVSYEQVSGNSDGITEVKAEINLVDANTMTQQAHYLKNGRWVKGHSARYRVVE